MKHIYLDYASTTPLSKHTKDYLIRILDTYGNPSSLHSVGQAAKQIISKARKSVAAFIHAEPPDIYFTSGGSAANTLGIKGYCAKHDCRVLYSPIAHKSILKCVSALPDSHPLQVHDDGRIRLSDLKEHLTLADRQPFVIIDYASSELGTIQDVEAITKLIHLHQGILYLDCTGSIATIPLDVKKTDADMCGFSAHKLGGLKGCGVFYKKPDIQVEPLIYGNQEQGVIGGTENVLGIASLGKAVEHLDYARVSAENRDFVYQYILHNIGDSYLIGSLKNRLAHNLYMCFPGVEGEALLALLDMNGIQVSTGSACNSGSLTASPALSAIGINPADIHSCIRMTFCGAETKEELIYVCEKIKECVERLRITGGH